MIKLNASCGKSPDGNWIELTILFKKLVPNAKMFARTREEDACMDMYSCKDTVIKPLETKIIPTGIAMELPDGWFGDVRPRSGLTSKGLIVHSGTIESGYRGEIGIMMTNLTNNSVSFPKYSRLAQIAFLPIVKTNSFEVDELSETSRGTNGYGSSGVTYDDMINLKKNKKI